MDDDIMVELSTPLRLAVASYINDGAMNSIPFFARCNDAMKQSILSSLQHRQFVPSEIIMEEGAIANEMFFLHRGKAVTSLASLPLVSYRMLRNGDYFGECGLISSTNFETVRATSYCECFALTRADFEEAIEGSPIAKKVKADIANFHLRSTLLGKRVLQNISNHAKCYRLVLEMPLVRKSTLSGLRGATVLLPNSAIYLVWNCFLFAACVYNAWMIPFRLVFGSSADSSVMIDWVFDIFFVLDMYLNFRFVGFIQDGEVVVDIERIKKNYMQRRFKMDIISSCPFDLLAFLFLPKVSLLIGLDLGDLLRVLKLLRFPRYFNVIEKVFALLNDRNIPLGPLRLVEFFGGVILIAHVAACGFFGFARWNKSDDYCFESDAIGCQWYGTWIYRQIFNGKLPTDGGDVWQQYIRSFNWALPTLVVVVIGDVVRR
jgi:hypothetical protein